MNYKTSGITIGNNRLIKSVGNNRQKNHRRQTGIHMSDKKWHRSETQRTNYQCSIKIKTNTNKENRE